MIAHFLLQSCYSFVPSINSVACGTKCLYSPLPLRFLLPKIMSRTSISVQYNDVLLCTSVNMVPPNSLIFVSELQPQSRNFGPFPNWKKIICDAWLLTVMNDLIYTDITSTYIDIMNYYTNYGFSILSHNW